MNSFRFKLGVLLAIIAGSFIVSQVVYRNTITSMHAVVSSAVDTVEIVHRVGHFNTSINVMLYLASHYSGQRDERTYQEYKMRRTSAGNMIDALIKSAGPGGDSTQHRHAEASKQPTGNPRSLFDAFARETDAIFSGADKQSSAHLEKARILSDEIIRNYVTVVCDYHEAHLISLNKDAHEMEKKVTFFFMDNSSLFFLWPSSPLLSRIASCSTSIRRPSAMPSRTA